MNLFFFLREGKKIYIIDWLKRAIFLPRRIVINLFLVHFHIILDIYFQAVML